jgi:integrase
MHRKANRHGGAVVVRTSKSGVKTFSLKWVDAAGEQAWERLGSETDGWTRSKARAALEERLTDVRREGLRRPARVTVADVAREWVAVYPTTRSLKRSTANGYASMVEHYVVPYLGHLPIDGLDVVVLDRFVAERLADGLAPATVNRQLNVLSLIVRSARKRKLLRDNPVELVDRPREQRHRWRILTPAEVGCVRAAFVRIADEADDDGERAWVEQAGAVFAVVYGLGLRRSEVLGLRWRHVRLADPEGPTLRVEETFVRDRVDTPKSRASMRTVAVGRVVAEALFEHRARSAYDADDDRVFCHVDTGGPLNHKRYADTLRAALKLAEVDGAMRPFHDGRHTAITNGAAAGVAPGALQAGAGHSDLGTTQRYIDLAGVLFRDEAEAAEARMFGTREPSTGANG